MIDTEKEELLNSRKKVSKEDIIRLVKTEFPIIVLKIKKKLKNLKRKRTKNLYELMAEPTAISRFIILKL